MSYILEALRKADAERERDPARGIHAQPMAGAPSGSGEGAARSRTLLLGVAGVVVLAGAVLLFQRMQAPAAAPAAPVAAAMQQPADVAPVAASVPATPVAAVPADVLLPLPAAPVSAAIPAAAAPAPAPRTAVAAARPVPRAPAVPDQPVTAPAPAVTQPVPAAPVVAAVPAAPGAPAALLKAPASDSGQVLALKDLPADVQRDLPKLAITGGVHSDNAAQRLLIVGGQVVNEGAVLAPGVVLEQIRARAAVLQFRGYRFSVGF